jgi:integrase
MREKKVLTDRAIRALKPAAKGERKTANDALVPGLQVRVSDTGHKSFILVARPFGRLKIGDYGAVSLEQARDTARRWHELIRKGVDPRGEAERIRLALAKEQEGEFSIVAEKFLVRIGHQRRAGDVRRIIQNVLVPAWQGRKLTEIARADVVDLVTEIAARAPAQARAVFGVTRSFFNWAVELYGLQSSPCDRVSLKRLIGERSPRKRVLTDEELQAFWTATEKLSYPYGPMFRLLLLTGARKNEIAKVKWSEVDERERLITVPPERFKSDAHHLIPLSTAAMTLIDQLPRTEHAEFMFSNTMGERPVRKIAEAKAKLDKFMKEEIPTMPHFWTHDLRRTLRTRLASLKIPDTVAEQCLGHGRRGLQRTYDQHSYLDEMREALELWAARLRDIIEPPPANVLKLKARR